MADIGIDPGMLYIDGQYFPPPTKYSITHADLDSSDTTRNESGVLVRNRVRQGTTKIALSFIVSGQQSEVMLACIEPAQVFVRYYDPRQNTLRESTMYVSDRSCTMKRCLPEDTISSILWEISFSLVEY